MFRTKNKRGIALDALAWWIIAIGIMALVIMGLIFVFKPSGISALQYIKDLLRFGK